MAYSFKGYLSFGFVYIPVTLHLAVKDNKVAFRLFDKKTMSKIQYKKTCMECHDREVKNDDIIRGYEYEDGKYVLIEDEDFEKIKTAKDKNITIEQFVHLDEIDPIYFNKSYYVIPTSAEKAYNLLLKSMKDDAVAGLGKTVIGNDESLVLIRVQDDHFVLSTLYFEEEIQPVPYTAIEKSYKKSELDLAHLLIKEMTKEFNPSNFEDEYSKKVNKMIKDKIKGNKIISKKEKNEPRIIDLMEALESSLKKYNKSQTKSKLTNKKKTTSNHLNLS